ncbi:uncharacterized protein LOC118745589 [Rhagoletis pomonella]|uniref:uncharacterized protein LOC118745589 n=1 Tax=Rhagoletis pomonella TaxID=28610 RepID=UPI00177C3F3B|nr:uncharacterized protein LOC118745589 [Rhagoletis pomonella]XP_036334986.1 uncharacterized protein LOC118745589 [Rhagoletis pomonella]
MENNAKNKIAQAITDTGVTVRKSATEEEVRSLLHDIVGAPPRSQNIRSADPARGAPAAESQQGANNVRNQQQKSPCNPNGDKPLGERNGSNDEGDIEGARGTVHGDDFKLEEVRSDRDADMGVNTLDECLQMLRLKKALNDFPTFNCKKKPNTYNYSLTDIEVLVPKFSGDDDKDVRKWVDEFEYAANTYGCDDDRKLLLARQLLTGSAKMLAEIVPRTWRELKTHLRDEFAKIPSYRDTVKTLEAPSATTTWWSL